MNQNMKYLTPKMPIAEIERQRAEEAEEQNIDLYEAIAGLYEELIGISTALADLESRIKKIEGGQAK